MTRKRVNIALLLAVLSTTLPLQLIHAQMSYTTTWVGNTYGTRTTYVGNAARSMWVAPEGVIYTASMWDENEGSVAIYQNGQGIGSIGLHNEFQGGAITGDSTYLFVVLQYNTGIGGSGYVGRYNRSSKARDLVFQVSATTTERRADVVTGLADTGTLVYASDYPGNRVRVFTADGAWQQDWSITGPGRIAVDGSGNVWVAQMSQGTIQEFNPSGVVLNTINMGSSARPSELYYDGVNNQLMVGDQGPNMNIQIYGNLAGTPSLLGTFGVQGGYLDTTTGIKGQTGDKRFTRVVGIGKDSAGNLYVLNNPWGGSWDLGRNGQTDIYCYNSSGMLVYTLQTLNFEGVGSPDPGTDGSNLYSGNNLFIGSAGAGYVANTIDPITYPGDERIQLSDPSRGQHFGVIAYVSGHRILVTAAQNCDVLYVYYFSTTSGYTAVPLDSIPGPTFGTTYPTIRIRSGFWLDTDGDLWVGYNNGTGITHYPLTGFDSTGKPLWGSGVATPVPSGSVITTLGRILYLPLTDQMILANAGTTSTGTVDWTGLGDTVEVYNAWSTNPTLPTLTISLNTTNNPKTLAAAGNYLFVGYVHTIPNIDAFNLTTGALDISMTSSDPNVAIGNDVDSMYGVRAYQTSTGQYVITKDNYNNNSIIIDTLSTSGALPAAPTGLRATAASSNQINLSWSASSGASSYNMKRSAVSGGPYSTIATGVTATTYSNTGLAASTAYYYVVSAVNAAGESPNSTEASATTPSLPPRPPTGLAATAGNAQVSLSWTASTGATSYSVKGSTVSGGPYATVASPTATSYTDSGLTNGTTYYYVVSAVNSGGESANSAQVSATPIGGSGGLPSGWSDQDIGSVGIAGGATYSSGSFTVNGSGADVWGTSDAFNYAYKSSTGNVTVTARVASVQNTAAWAKAGVMIRETTAANSKYVFVFVTPVNGVNLQYRSSTGGGAGQGAQISGLAAPYWVRLVRSGSTFTAYASADGSSWTQVGSVSVTMATGALEGLAVTAHNNTRLNTSIFDDVTAP